MRVHHDARVSQPATALFIPVKRELYPSVTLAFDPRSVTVSGFPVCFRKIETGQAIGGGYVSNPTRRDRSVREEYSERIDATVGEENSAHPRGEMILSMR